MGVGLTWHVYVLCICILYVFFVYFRFDGALPLLGKLITYIANIYIANPNEEGITNLLERMKDLTGLFYSNLKRSYRPLLGVRFDGLVVSCKFKGKECTEAHFKHYLHPSLVNCYTFQANLTNSSRDGNLLVGPQSGLSLILRSEANANFYYNNLDNVKNVDSIRLAIHAPGTVPFLMNKGINLEAGKSTSVSLMMKTFQRLGQPYTKCQPVETFDVDSRTFLSTSEACREKCITEAMRSRCNCTSTLFEDLTISEHEYCLQISDTFSVDELNTMNDRTTCESAFVDYVAGLSCSHCVWDCHEIDYDREVAFSNWPHENKIEDFIYMYILRTFWNYPDLRPCNDTIRSYYALLLKKANISTDLCQDLGDIGNNTKQPLSIVSISNAMRSVYDMFQYARPDFLDVFRYEADVPKSYYNIKSVDELQKKWIKDSFYRLNVFFRQSTVEQHEQVASFSLPDLLSGKKVPEDLSHCHTNRMGMRTTRPFLFWYDTDIKKMGAATHTHPSFGMTIIRPLGNFLHDRPKFSFQEQDGN